MKQTEFQMKVAMHGYDKNIQETRESLELTVKTLEGEKQRNRVLLLKIIEDRADIYRKFCH